MVAPAPPRALRSTGLALEGTSLCSGAGRVLHDLAEVDTIALSRRPAAKTTDVTL